MSVLGKQGLRLTSATVASCRKQRRRKSCQEDDHWVGGTGWAAQRVWTERPAPGWAGLHRRWKQWWERLGREPVAKESALSWPRCWTDGQEHLGWWPGGEADRTGREASVYWRVGGSVLLLLGGKLPEWVWLVTRMDVVSGPKRSLFHRLLHSEHLGVRFLAQCSRTGPSPFLLPAHFPIFLCSALGTRTLIPLAPSPISKRESQMKSILIFLLFIPVFYL